MKDDALDPLFKMLTSAMEKLNDPLSDTQKQVLFPAITLYFKEYDRLLTTALEKIYGIE